MSKPTLVRFAWTDLNSSYLEWILQDKFDLAIFNPTNTYNKETDILVILGSEQELSGANIMSLEPDLRKLKLLELMDILIEEQ